MIVRKFQNEDRLSILELSKRFNNIDYLAFRDEHIMCEKQEGLAIQAITNNKENVYIAECNGAMLGYIELAIQEDYFTNRKQAYVSAIAVSEKGEGKGIGKELMKQAEEWAADQGLTEIILDVFLNNKRAVSVYEHLGYQKEIVKMVKIL
ncbi:GNAT family N-acetyltransferase [Alkalicoccobacillus murimartini]|uniref:Ribosomal protein S18 acetylase RimI-like enzyme n=1 Tax=Alkalicoccobacillus murimartini TaxID=171685 RepID=A0ABT9YKH1_9BACI|nr:GNAT family N-acetyltransferase [Alkalicoccobacillus murimartini]MDQ0207524.1 ribosomal protein S18 acetylase RimI-like enzyme [Alkalicoccobacillus murimartini]